MMLMETTTFNDKLEPAQTKNYKAEGDEIIENLKNDETYCRHFFFDYDVPGKNGQRKNKACQIASMRSKMVFDLKKEYGIEVKPEFISYVAYLTLWANGTWQPLDKFEGHSSFFAWLKKVIKHAVTLHLIEDGVIPEPCSQTVGNTRLTLLSKSPIICNLLIDKLMPPTSHSAQRITAGSTSPICQQDAQDPATKHHSLLTAIYVDRLSKAEIMEKLHLTDADYEAAKQQAEDKLKDALLRSVEFSQENLFSNKKGQVVTVSAEFVADIAEWNKSKHGVNPFSDIFGTDLTDEEVSAEVVNFLYEFSEKLQWSDLDRYIWRKRFIENASPVALAEQLNHSRGWIDTRYSRLNAKFEAAIQKWWKKHAP